MSRISRLKEYAAMKGPKGAGRDEENLRYWANRAEQNSDGDQHRGYDGPMKLPSTRVNVRDTSMSPKVTRSVEAVMKAAKSDKNDVGSTFMTSVRRGTS